MTLYLYTSLGKPRLVGLLMLVSAVAYVIAGGGTIVGTRLALLMGAGGFSAVGASMLNHYLERDLDALMPRTSERPLASGRIASPARVAWAGCALVAGGVALGFALGLFVGLMVGLGAAVYVLLYTGLMKRRTHWSVVIGGISGSCAALGGWFTGASPSMVALLVGLLLFTWQSAHFWPLALARIAEYERAGIPMLPAVVGPRRAGAYIFLASVATAGVAFALGLAAELGALYLVGGAVLAGLWVSVTGRLLIDTSQRAAWLAFKASGIYLAAIFLLALIDVIVVA